MFDVDRQLRRLDRYKPILGSVPIAGITGPNGAGKTLVMVAEALSDLRAGRPVYSTVPIRLGPYASEPIRSLGQLVGLRDATVCLDEIVSIFPSSAASNSLPAEVQVLINTARHRGITVRWSAPAWMRAQVMLREVTQAAVSVNPVGKRRPRWGLFGDPGLWPEPLWSAVVVWDARSGKVDSPPERRLRRRALLLRRSPGFGAYDTLADAPVIGHPDAGGVCVDCGGSRRRPQCSPERHQQLGLLDELPVPDEAPIGLGEVTTV